VVLGRDPSKYVCRIVVAQVHLATRVAPTGYSRSAARTSREFNFRSANRYQVLPNSVIPSGKSLTISLQEGDRLIGVGDFDKPKKVVAVAVVEFTSSGNLYMRDLPTYATEGVPVSKVDFTPAAP